VISNQLQSLIVRGFRDLLATDGGARSLRTPLVEPDSTSFPDAWTPDQAGVHRLLRRIMFHAGLGDVPLLIKRFVFEADENDGADGAAQGRHVIAYFEGITDGTCSFGVNCAQLGDPEFLSGVLAHEVAHAYRSIHGLVVEDTDEEEDLTDLTTIFLGFGILTTNNARQATISANEHRERRAGYLSPHAMAFALAFWVRARGLASDQELIERWVEPLQRSIFRKVLAELPSARVLERLGLPRTFTVDAPTPPMLDDAPALALDAQPIDFSSTRSDTFRVSVRRERFGAVVGLLSVGMLTFAQQHTLDFVGVFFMIAAAACGFGIGRWLSYDACARRDCEVRIPPRAAHCPRCGSVIQGVITDPLELGDALEALRRRRVASRRAAPT
jgi:hypothetical protein